MYNVFRICYHACPKSQTREEKSKLKAIKIEENNGTF